MGLPHREGCECCEAARKRIVEITQAKDKENARLTSRVAKYDAAFAQARERTKDAMAHWAVEPWKSQRGTYFSMTSIIEQEAWAQLCYDLNEARERLQRFETV